MKQVNLGSQGLRVPAIGLGCMGMSEVSAASLKKANSVHSITALQSEYSIWVRDIEKDILPTCRELNVAVVPYSPLGRGFLTGNLTNNRQFDDNNFRKDIPLFQGENFINNLNIVKELEKIAASKNCTTRQLALTWLKHQGDDIFPIPGTKRRAYLKENIRSLMIDLTDNEVDQIKIVSESVRGYRKNESGMLLLDN